VDETGTLDYGQTIHNNIVINSLEHHCVTAQPATLQGVQDQDDIISLDDNSSEMDLIYQQTTSFPDIAQQLASSSAQHLSAQDNTNSTSTLTSTAHTSHVASQNNNQQNKVPDATVTQNQDHVSSQIANDVVELDVTHVVSQVAISRGAPQKLNDSIHALKGKSIVNLPQTIYVINLTHFNISTAQICQAFF